jgi:hypothetical protein
MQNTRVVRGIRTNKNVKTSKTIVSRGENTVTVATVPALHGYVEVSMEKKNRWEIVEEAEKQTRHSPKKSKSERVKESKQEKRKIFQETLKLQKQKHEKRIPEKPASDDEEKTTQEDQQDDSEEWQVVVPHRRSRFWSKKYTKQIPEGEIVIEMKKSKKQILTTLFDIHNRGIHSQSPKDKGKHSLKKMHRGMNPLLND